MRQLSITALTRGALLLLMACAGQPGRAQAPLIPPAAPAPAPAPPPAPPDADGPPLPDFVLLLPPPPPAAPGLPDLPLAAPPAPLLPRPRLRVVLPPRPSTLPPVLPAAPFVTERTVVYGRSAQGRALSAFVLDNGMPAAGSITLVFGGFHGNERATPGVVERLRLFLRQTPGSWVGSRVVLVPYANPDGWAAGTRANGRGVDINRNFPAGWQPSAQTVRYSPGPHAASEPETQAIIALLRRYHPAKIISLHSPLHCLNWTGSLGRTMALAMHATDGLSVKAYIGYPTPGSLGDYCGARGIGIVTLELPAESANAAWPQNRAAFLSVINLRPSAQPKS